MPSKVEREVISCGFHPDQQAFVMAYDGDATSTAERVGVRQELAILWTQCDWFRDAMQKRCQMELKALLRDNIYQLGKAVVPRLEIQAFWSDTMTNTQVELKDRLKASELLAKSQGMMVEKVVHSGEVKMIPKALPADLGDRIALLLGKPVDVELRTVTVEAETNTVQGTEDEIGDDWLDAGIGEDDWLDSESTPARPSQEEGVSGGMAVEAGESGEGSDSGEGRVSPELGASPGDGEDQPG